MVISMLPMNVFGAGSAGPIFDAYGTADTDATGDASRDVTVTVPMAAMAGLLLSPADEGPFTGGQRGILLEFVLTDLLLFENSPNRVHAGTGALTGQRAWTFDGVGNTTTMGALEAVVIERPGTAARPTGTTRVLVPVWFDDVVPFNELGHLEVTIPNVRPATADANLQVHVQPWQTTTQTFGRLPGRAAAVNQDMVYIRDAGIAISIGTEARFANVIRLGDIILRENRPGALTGGDFGSNDRETNTVLLRAPRGFTWVHEGVGGISNPVSLSVPAGTAHDVDPTPVIDRGGPNQTDAWASIDATYDFAARTPSGRIMGTGVRELLLLDIDVQRSANAIIASQVLEARISGLVLVPIGGQGQEANPRIDIFVNPDRYVITNDVLTFRSTANRSRTNIEVGTLAEGDLYTAPGEDIPTIDSGLRFYRAGEVVGANNVGHNADFINGGAASLTITETVPGTMLRSLQEFTIELNQLGVVFTDFSWRIGTTGNWNAPDEGSVVYNVTNQRITIMPNVITEEVPGTGGEETRIAAIPLSPRSIQFRFGISVAPGFEGDHGDEISVSIRERVLGYIGSEVIANVEDPIQVQSLTPGIAPPAGIFAVRDLVHVGDFTFRERDEAYFDVGDEIWLYAVSTQAGRPVWFNWLDMNIDASLIIESNNGMILDRARWEYVEMAGGRQVRVLKTTVLSPSNDGPANITVRDITFLGGLTPGVTIELVVSGPRIAPNNYIVYFHENEEDLGALTPPINAPHAALRDIVGLFDNLPYSTTIVVLAPEADVEGPGGLPGAGGNVIPLELRPGMGSIWTNVDNDPQLVEAPFRFVPNPVNANYTMGMLSPRVFAHWISGSTGFDDGVVTLTGMHFDGTPVEVVMTVGQNYAFINGQRHDIATFAARDGHGTGPTGSVTPMNVDGRVFVPIRFLTNAFGRFVTFDGDFPNVVVTLEG